MLDNDQIYGPQSAMEIWRTCMNALDCTKSREKGRQERKVADCVMLLKKLRHCCV